MADIGHAGHHFLGRWVSEHPGQGRVGDENTAFLRRPKDSFSCVLEDAAVPGLRIPQRFLRFLPLGNIAHESEHAGLRQLEKRRDDFHLDDPSIFATVASLETVTPGLANALCVLDDQFRRRLVDLHIADVHGKQLLAGITAHAAVGLVHVHEIPFKINHPETLHRGANDFLTQFLAFLERLLNSLLLGEIAGNPHHG